MLFDALFDQTLRDGLYGAHPGPPATPMAWISEPTWLKEAALRRKARAQLYTRDRPQRWPWAQHGWHNGQFFKLSQLFEDVLGTNPSAC